MNRRATTKDNGHSVRQLGVSFENKQHTHTYTHTQKVEDDDILRKKATARF